MHVAIHKIDHEIGIVGHNQGLPDDLIYIPLHELMLFVPNIDTFTTTLRSFQFSYISAKTSREEDLAAYIHGT